MTERDAPLSGLVVVELGDSASAPFAGKVLAELGAEVWKVERPSGDSSRAWGPSMWKGSGAAFHALNRGKRMICIDIKNPDQLEQLKTLIVDHADVFLHNLRPGSSRSYGLDAETLRVRKPDLIHCEVGAFGSSGPLRGLPGYDPLLQAFSGIMSVTGEEGQAPVRAGVSIVDFGTGMWAVIGILSALFRRGRTTIGASVSSSLLETALAWMSVGVANYQVDGEPGGRFGSGVAFIAPHRAYATSDGYLVVSCANDALFARLCQTLGHPEWAADDRFQTNGARLANRSELDRLIGEVLASQARDYWRALLEGAGIPVAPIQTTAEVAQHEQIAALGILTTPPDDQLALVGLPLSFEGNRPAVPFGAHDTGAHNDELTQLLNSAVPSPESADNPEQRN